MKEKDIISNGLYIVKDTYFSDFPTTRLMDNKKESRPNYYALPGKGGIYWMIPLSSRTAKYKNLISQTEKRYGPGSCVLWDIEKICGVERAVLIGNMFPVTADYIARAYTISGIPYIVKNAHTVKRIRAKAMRYLNLIERGRIQPVENVLDIRSKLLSQNK